MVVEGAEHLHEIGDSILGDPRQSVFSLIFQHQPVEQAALHVAEHPGVVPRKRSGHGSQDPGQQR